MPRDVTLLFLYTRIALPSKCESVCACGLVDFNPEMKTGRLTVPQMEGRRCEKNTRVSNREGRACWSSPRC